jgi:hypothetical protein
LVIKKKTKTGGKMAAKKKTTIAVIIGAVVLAVAAFFGINLNGPQGTDQLIGTDGQAFTTNNLVGNLTGQNYTVYVTKSGKRYHLENCRYVLGKKIPINLNEAVDEGYTPCKRCKPDANVTYLPQDTAPQKAPETENGPGSSGDKEPEPDPYLE